MDGRRHGLGAPRHGIVFLQPAQRNVGTDLRAPGDWNTGSIARSISDYSAFMGSLPTGLTDLTSVVSNSFGQTAGPFMASVPSGPSGWGAYTYTSTASGVFTISNSGDSTSVSLP